MTVSLRNWTEPSRAKVPLVVSLKRIPPEDELDGSLSSITRQWQVSRVRCACVFRARARDQIRSAAGRTTKRITSVFAFVQLPNWQAQSLDGFIWSGQYVRHSQGEGVGGGQRPFVTEGKHQHIPSQVLPATHRWRGGTNLHFSARRGSLPCRLYSFYGLQWAAYTYL